MDYGLRIAHHFHNFTHSGTVDILPGPIRHYSITYSSIGYGQKEQGLILYNHTVEPKWSALFWPETLKSSMWD